MAEWTLSGHVTGYVWLWSKQQTVQTGEKYNGVWMLRGYMNVILFDVGNIVRIVEHNCIVWEWYKNLLSSSSLLSL